MAHTCNPRYLGAFSMKPVDNSTDQDLAQNRGWECGSTGLISRTPTPTQTQTLESFFHWRHFYK